jgi:hypothetical protein
MLAQPPPECPPPECPLLDTVWPVDPKPPREVDEPELVDVLLPRAVEESAVETAIGARRDQYERVLEYRPSDE